MSLEVVPNGSGGAGGGGTPGNFTTLHVTGASALDGAVTFGSTLTLPLAMADSVLRVDSLGVVQAIPNGAVNTVLVGNGAGVAPSFSATPSYTSMRANFFAATLAGTVPATGVFRMTQPGAQLGIVGRNNADGADMTWAIADASDNLTFGDVVDTTRVKLAAATAVQIAMASPVLELGTSALLATTGQIRAASNVIVIAAKDFLGVGNVEILATDGASNIIIGGTATGAVRTKLAGSSGVQIAMASPRLEIGSTAAIGTVGTGQVRFAGGAITQISALNNGATVDMPILRTDVLDVVILADKTATTRLRLSAATAIQVDTSTGAIVEFTTGAVSTIGNMRFPAAASNTLIGTLNAAGAANIAILGTDASDNVWVGSTSASASQAVRVKIAGSTGVQIAMTTPVLELGNTAVAATGTIRSAAVTARTTWAALNAAGSADLAIVAFDASDNLYIGGTSTSTLLFTRHILRASTAVQIGMATPVLELGTATGANVASIGEIRSAVATARTLFAVRNAAASADIAVLAIGGSNDVWVGTTNAGAAQAATTNVNGSTSSSLRAAGTAKVTVTTTTTTLASNATVDIQSTTTTRIKVDGTGIGFFNTAPVAQQAVGAITNSVTAGGVTGTIANYTDLVIYANDAAAIRNDIYQLALGLAQCATALRNLGLAI